MISVLQNELVCDDYMGRGFPFDASIGSLIVDARLEMIRTRRVLGMDDTVPQGGAEHEAQYRDNGWQAVNTAAMEAPQFEAIWGMLATTCRRGSLLLRHS